MPYAFLPQPKSVTRDVLSRGLRSSFPPGWFNLEPGSYLHQQIDWLVDAMLPVYQLAQTLQDEMNPGTSTAERLLSEWEKFSIDSKCIDVSGLTEDQRRILVVAALKGGDPELTLTELDTNVKAAFATVTFDAPTESAALRVKEELRVTNAFIGDFPFVTIKPQSSSANESTAERIRCYVGTILPVTVIFFVVRS